MSQRSSSSSNHAEAEAEIELPRLEDSRASLMQLPQLDLPPLDLLLMLPRSHRARRLQDPLLSSTMMQESGTLDQDWPTASSIALGGSRDDNSGTQLSEKLNNAKLGFSGLLSDVATDVGAAAGICEFSASSVSAAAVADSIAGNSAAISASDANIPSILEDSSSDDAADSAAATTNSLASQDASPSSRNLQPPRLRILHGDENASEENRSPGWAARQQEANAEQLHNQQQQPPQRMLGLLQVCCLTLDVLSEGGLLSDDARRWLTPELLCDKLCDRLSRPPRQPPPTGADAAASLASLTSSVSMSFEDDDDDSESGGSSAASPTTRRVRRWLKATADAAAASPATAAPGEPWRANRSI